MAEQVKSVHPPQAVKDQLPAVKKEKKERRPPLERFAAQTFGQLVPGIQACKEMIAEGTMPPQDVVQAAGALNAAMANWFQNYTE